MTKMPSRLIQGLDNFDTCSQFSDSATLHTLTRMGALQKEVYFSRSESNFHNFDTISYGNSSTCCCDAEIKVHFFIGIYLLTIIFCAYRKCGLIRSHANLRELSQNSNRILFFNGLNEIGFVLSMK